jgi:hypothetical protein
MIVRLQLFALAYNIANFMRRLVLPRRVNHWSLTTLREKLIKTGARILRYARYIKFQMAEVGCRGRCSSKFLAASRASCRCGTRDRDDIDSDFHAFPTMVEVRGSDVGPIPWIGLAELFTIIRAALFMRLLRHNMTTENPKRRIFGTARLMSRSTWKSRLK